MTVNLAWIDDNQTVRAEVPYALLVYPSEDNKTRFMFHIQNRDQLAILGGSVMKVLITQEVFEASLSKVIEGFVNEARSKTQGK